MTAQEARENTLRCKKFRHENEYSKIMERILSYSADGCYEIEETIYDQSVKKRLIDDGFELIEPEKRRKNYPIIIRWEIN